MADRKAELGALQDAVSNNEAAPSRLGLAGYIRGLFLDWSANPYNPLTRLSARGRLLGYFWDSGAIGLSMNFADQNYLIKDGTVKSKSFSEIVNFTRTTNATVTNSAGLITFAPMNLLTFSEQFDNAAWTKQRATINSNIIVAPNGTLTADKLTEDTQTGNHTAFVSINVTSGLAYTFSVYIKAAERGFAQVRYSNSGATEFYAINVNLSNGTFAAVSFGSPTGTSSSVTHVGDGWYRCAITSNTTNTSFTAQVFSQLVQGANSYTGDNTSGIYLWGAQLEIGSTATTYNPTTVKNLLGFSELFDNAAWTKSNSFVQTNGITYSEALDNAAWTKSGTTITANDTLAPNGYQTADKVVETATTARHFTYPATYAVVTGNVYTVSFYAKAAERTLLQVSGSVYTGYANIDLSTGTQVAGTSSFVIITPDANGFYKIVFTFTSTATSTSVPFSLDIITNSTVGRGLSSYAGDGTSGLYAWGFQVVQGSVAGDYRRTDSAALPVYYPNHNGVVVAEKLVPNTTSTTHFLNQAVTTVAGTTYTYSAYIKAGGYNFAVLYISGANVGRYFNLSAGTVGNTFIGAPLSESITSLGDGWYRCSITYTATASSTPTIYVNSSQSASFAGDGTSGIYIFGAQLSDSASLDPYVLNAAAAPTAAAYYGARFDYDPVTLQPKGLLIEEQRANLLLNSSLAGTNLATQNVTVTAVAHTLSFYGTGQIVLSGTSSATVTGTGAYPTRRTLTFTPTAGTLTLTVTGTVQYAQLEIGSFATSFIPTAASQVTRAADNASIVGSNFFSWYNQNEGSALVNGLITPEVDGVVGNFYLSLNDGTVNNDIRIIDVNGSRSQISFNGTTQFDSTLIGESNLYKKMAISYKLNDSVFSVNGSIGTVDNSVTTPIVNRLLVGVRSDLNASTYANGHIKQISYYPQRLSNDVLKGLTA